MPKPPAVYRPLFYFQTLQISTIDCFGQLTSHADTVGQISFKAWSKHDLHMYTRSTIIFLRNTKEIGVRRYKAHKDSSVFYKYYIFVLYFDIYIFDFSF